MKVRVNTSHLDCWNEPEIVCPFCGYKHQDSWEVRGGATGHLGELECDSCTRTFEAQRDVTVTYYSGPKGSKGDWEKGDVFEDGIDNLEDEKFANEHGKQICEIVQ